MSQTDEYRISKIRVKKRYSIQGEDRFGSAAKRILPQSTDENHPRGVGSGFF